MLAFVTSQASLTPIKKKTWAYPFALLPTAHFKAWVACAVVGWQEMLALGMIFPHLNFSVMRSCRLYLSLFLPSHAPPESRIQGLGSWGRGWVQTDATSGRAESVGLRLCHLVHWSQVHLSPNVKVCWVEERVQTLQNFISISKTPMV